jgi:hypothetical protein
MAGTIRYNEDYSEFQVVLADGTEFEPEDMPETGVTIIEHPDDIAQNFLVVLSTFDADDSNLDPNTIYLLTPVATQTEDNVEFEGDEDEDEEEEAELPPTA